jgi:hypothetical protein
MRVGGIGGTPFRPFGGVRLSLGAFRQGLTALARRVPFPPNFGGVGRNAFLYVVTHRPRPFRVS